MMKGKGVSPIDVRKTSKPSWLSSSFRVSVAEQDFQRSFSDGFWPKVLKFREWVSNFKRRDHQDDATSTNGEEDDDEGKLSTAAGGTPEEGVHNALMQSNTNHHGELP